MPKFDEDMPIESGMLTRSLESAQKVETYYTILENKFLNMTRCEPSEKSSTVKD